MVKIKIKNASIEVSRKSTNPITKITPMMTTAPATEKSNFKFSKILTPISPVRKIPIKEIKIIISPPVIFGFINLNFLVLKKCTDNNIKIGGIKMDKPPNFDTNI